MGGPWTLTPMGTLWTGTGHPRRFDPPPGPDHSAPNGLDNVDRTSSRAHPFRTTLPTAPTAPTTGPLHPNDSNQHLPQPDPSPPGRRSGLPTSGRHLVN
jgi:hypothetical protein